MIKSFCKILLLILISVQYTWAAPINIPDFAFSAYLDTSYNYLSRENVFTSGILVRNNDIEQNGFTLQQAAFTASILAPQGFGGLLNIIAGRDANQLSPAGWNPYFGSQTLAIDPEQLYLQYAISSFTFIAGKFGSFGGYESNDPALNINFSFSPIATFAEPSTHVGLRGTYTASKTLNVSLGANNGWDTLHHASRLQTIELAGQWHPHAIVLTSLAIYSGKQYMADPLAEGPVGIRNFANFYAVVTPMEKLKLILNSDYGVQNMALRPDGTLGRVVWAGITGYVNYLLTERWYVTLRSDLFNDQNGFRTGVRQCLKEVTLTLGFSPFKNLLFRAEARHDFSNTNSFVNNSVSTSNNLQSFALEGLYTFS